MKIAKYSLVCAAALAISTPGYVLAQDWPSETVRIVVGFTPGGSSDLAARLLANGIAEEINGTVIVENKPGAGATIAAGLVAASDADGYTIYLSNVTANSIAPSTYPDLPYDPIADFDEVITLGIIPAVLLANKDAPVNSLEELVAYAKERPNKVNFGSGGHGTMNHLVGELLNKEADLTLKHVAYKGSAQAMNDLMAGVIPFQVDALTQNVGQIASGAVKALAITTPTRSPQAPDVPTFTELGYPDIVALNWVGFSAPDGTPADVIAKLNTATQTVLAKEDIQAQFKNWGMEIVANSPAEAEEFVVKEEKRWREVVATSQAFQQ